MREYAITVHFPSEPDGRQEDKRGRDSLKVEPKIERAVTRLSFNW